MSALAELQQIHDGFAELRGESSKEAYAAAIAQQIGTHIAEHVAEYQARLNAESFDVAQTHHRLVLTSNIKLMGELLDEIVSIAQGIEQ